MKRIDVITNATHLTMLATLLLATLALLTPAQATDAFTASEAVAPQLEPRWVVTSGLRRRYWVHVPPDAMRTEPSPVVVAFHGGLGNAPNFADSNSLAHASAARGYLAVFPEGTRRRPPGTQGRTWNAGNCCGVAMQENVNDVQFFRDLLNALSREFSVDPDRVYATGISNGAMMAYRIGLEAPELLAAIAPVAGARGVEGAPNGPLPVVAFHGLLDQNIPFHGGVGIGVSGTDFFSQAESIGPFFDVNQCNLADSTKDVSGEAIRYEMPSPIGHDIHYWLLQDGGHTWPGQPAGGGGAAINQDIDASEVMLDFFDAHHRP
ncbi:MAG: esterase [Nitrospirales bacterium]|nr:MAG: esterase [Nitrospirales bacterium]